MTSKIETKISDAENWDGFVEEAAEIYRACGFTDFDQDIEALLHSSYFGVVYLDGKPVGVGRVISDSVHYSLIIDLNVLKEYRGRGCGTVLARALAEHAKTRNVMLTTDPKNPTLPEFYKKAGFVLSENEFVFDWPKDG